MKAVINEDCFVVQPLIDATEECSATTGEPLYSRPTPARATVIIFGAKDDTPEDPYTDNDNAD